jgi:metal-responsive CopG/Arc/MetJ family transcriptional regulator
MKRDPKIVLTFRANKILNDKIDDIVDASTMLNKSNVIEAAIRHFVLVDPF